MSAFEIEFWGKKNNYHNILDKHTNVLFVKQHSHENTLWTEHGKTKNFVDEVWIMQIVTLFLIFNLKTQQRRWSVKKIRQFFPEKDVTRWGAQGENCLKSQRWTSALW